MKLVNVNKLVELLNSYTGFVGLVTATEPKMVQKNRETKALNPFLGKTVLRTAQRHGMLGTSYEKAVNNHREAEGHPLAGEFKAEQLWGGAGEHVPGSKTLVRHRTTGKQYLVFYPHREGSVVQDTWTVDGEEVSLDTLAPYLPVVSEGSKRQEVEKTVAWRTVALENLVQVTMDGETYLVVAR